MPSNSRTANFVLIVCLVIAIGVLAVVVRALVREVGPAPALASTARNSLHEAAISGNVSIIKAAAGRGDEINAPLRGEGGRAGMTPLICAAYEGKAEAVTALLEAGAKVDTRADDGRTALMYAAGWGTSDRVKAILDFCAKPEAKTDRTRLVNMTVPEGGWAALMFAAASGEAESIKALIQAGAEVDARNKWRQTALMAAARSGDPAKVRALLDAGAAVDAADSDTTTALGVAAANNGTADVMRVLLDAGAKIDAADFEGVTPLMRAAYRADRESIALLLERRASAELKDSNGWTAADWARSRDDDEGRDVAARFFGARK